MKGLTKTRLKKFLRDLWELNETEDGDFYALLSADESCPVPMAISFSLGNEKEMLQVQSLPLQCSIPAKSAGEAVILCNDWNRKERIFGTAFFDPKSIMVGMKTTIGLQHEVSAEEVNEIAFQTMASSVSLFSMAAAKFGWASVSGNHTESEGDDKEDDDEGDECDFRMPIEDTFNIKGRGYVATGTIERGIIHVGDSVRIVSGRTEVCESFVEGINIGKKLCHKAAAGSSVGLLFRKPFPIPFRLLKAGMNVVK